MSTFQFIAVAIAFGLSFGTMHGIYKFGSLWKEHRIESWKNTAAAFEESMRMWKASHAELESKWSKLVDRINAKGGERFLNRGVIISDEIARLSAPPFDKDEIKTLIKLCHPDKHGGSDAAQTITRKLLDMRK